MLTGQDDKEDWRLEVKSMKDPSYRILNWILIIFLGYVLIGFLKLTFESNYYELRWMVLAIMTFLFFISWLFDLLLYKKIGIKENRLSITSIRGKKTFYTSDVIAFYEEEINFNKYSEYDILYLKFSTGYVLKLNSLFYKNYAYLRNRIISDDLRKDKKDFRVYIFLRELKYIFFGVVLSMVFIGAFVSRINNNILVPSEELTTIKVTFEEDPFREINKRKERAVLNLKENKNFTFILSSDVFEHLKEENRLHNNELSLKTAYLVIEKTEYNMKIAKSYPPDFVTKHMGWNKIFVLQILSEDYRYVDLDDVIKEKNNDDFVGYIFLIIGLLLVFAMVIMPLVEMFL